MNFSDLSPATQRTAWALARESLEMGGAGNPVDVRVALPELAEGVARFPVLTFEDGTHALGEPELVDPNAKEPETIGWNKAAIFGAAGMEARTSAWDALLKAHAQMHAEHLRSQQDALDALRVTRRFLPEVDGRFVTFPIHSGRHLPDPGRSHLQVGDKLSIDGMPYSVRSVGGTAIGIDPAAPTPPPFTVSPKARKVKPFEGDP